MSLPFASHSRMVVGSTKRGGGAVGILTGGLVSRQQVYELLVAYALSPWLEAL